MANQPSRDRLQTIKQWCKSHKDEVKHMPGKAQGAFHARIKQQYNDLQDFGNISLGESYLLEDFSDQIWKVWQDDYDTFNFAPTKTESKNKKRQHTFKNCLKFRLDKEEFEDFRGDNLWRKRDAWNIALKVCIQTGIQPNDVERFTDERDEVARRDWLILFGTLEDREEIKAMKLEDRDPNENV